MAKANATTIERHRDSLVCLAKEADEIKLKIEEKKIANGSEMDEVCKWSDKIDKGIEGVDAEIEPSKRSRNKWNIHDDTKQRNGESRVSRCCRGS